MSVELPSVGFNRDRCLPWLSENSVAVPQKVKPGVSTRPSSSTPRSTPKRIVGVFPHRLLNVEFSAALFINIARN